MGKDNATKDNILQKVMWSEPNFMIMQHDETIIMRTISTTWVENDELKMVIWKLKNKEAEI